MPDLYAITIRLPWAAAVADGEKLVENRGHPVHEGHVGRRLGIHAGLAWSVEGARDWRVRRWWYGRGAPRSLGRADFRRQFGMIIAVATLVGCHKAVPDLGAGPDGACCAPWGDRLYGGRGRTNQKGAAYHLVLGDVVALDDPVETRGYLWVPFLLPGDVTERVLAQVEVPGV